MYQRLRLIGMVVLALLAVVLVVQNIQRARVGFLFISVEMPLALLLFITFALGFAIGVLMAGRVKRSQEQ